MTNQDLRASCFPRDFCLVLAIPRSSSVTSLALSENDSDESKEYASKSSLPIPPTYVSMLRKLDLLSRATNARVSEQLEPRSGKVKQRWAVDPQTGQYLRLVAGCVPILNDARVVLISSSSGKGWLIPKGGWESDEELEEGAIRECFEEAGVLGMLGPRFDSFCCETRKALQFRLESSMEESAHSGIREDEKSQPPTPSMSACDLRSLVPATSVHDGANPENKNASKGFTHTHVCMTFFPLYVQQIYDSWPENSRKRQAFTIDEAMEIIRPEFRPILSKLKSSGLHLVGKDSTEFGPM